MARILGAACALVLAAATPARGAGFAINEAGARSLGMANAVTAIADDASAIFFNPAGAARLAGLRLQAAVSLVAPRFGYTTTPPGGGQAVEVDAERRLFTIPALYATYRIHETVSVGLGLYSPYGLGTRWADKVEATGLGWWGRAFAKETDLQTVYVTPSVGFRVLPRLYVGAGFSVVLAGVTLKRAVTMSARPEDDVDLTLSGEDVAFAGSAGLLVEAIPGRLDLGLTYRGGPRLTFEGTAAFTRGGSGAAVPAGLRSRLKDGRVKSVLRLPHVFSAGAAVYPLAGLTVSAALDIVTWSGYDALAVEFLDAPELSTREPKEWKNTLTLRLGAEYRPLPKLAVRAGFVFDESPVPPHTVGPELPDADRYVIALGGGYEIAGLQVDVAYQFLLTGDVETVAPAPITGTRRATAHIVSLGLGYTFDI